MANLGDPFYEMVFRYNTMVLIQHSLMLIGEYLSAQSWFKIIHVQSLNHRPERNYWKVKYMDLKMNSVKLNYGFYFNVLLFMIVDIILKR